MFAYRGRSTWSLDPSMRLWLRIAGLCLIANVAIAADSAYLGRGVSSVSIADAPCAPQAICFDSVLLWTFRVDKALSGPTAKGLVRAIEIGHLRTPRSVKAVELVVLSPISDPAVRSKFGADYRLVAFSSRDRSDNFCLSTEPSALGLHIPLDHVTADPAGGYYCFPRSDVIP
jgi:hypothetical protein